MANTKLTTGSLNAILSGLPVDKPLLQVLNMKKIQSDSSSQERYRLQLSDGDKHQPCMLATQMNHKILNNEIDKYCVIKLNRFVCNTIHERKIIILIDVTVLMSGNAVGGPIGEPTTLDLVRVTNGSSAGTNQPPNGVGGRGMQMAGGGGGGGGGYQAGRGMAQQNSFRPAPPSGGSAFNGSPYSNAAPPNRPGGVGGVREGGAMVTGGGGGGSLSQRNIFPISSLSPYQNKWTIRVRVASKPSIRTWSNSRGEGRVFNVDLVDQSGEIRACGFNQVADKMHAIFEMGKVYYLSRGRLKPANRQFNNTNNDYELSLNEDTEVELCTDAASDSLPSIQYHFKSIADIESVDPNSMIDVIGVCKETADVTSIVTKTTNRKVNKRDLYLVDRSGRTVTCTLWGAEAEEFDGSQFPVVAIKGARVSDFGGRSLSTVSSSSLVVDPDIPEAHQLRGWFDSVGKNENTQSISTQRGMGGGGSVDTPYLVFSQAKELDLGVGEKPDYFSCKGTVVFVKKENCLYKACPSSDCNKKVTEGSGGEYFCEKCNRTFPDFKYRMILSINAADHTGSQWLTCFQDTGTEVLGVDAQQLGEMMVGDEEAFNNVFQAVNFKDFTFKIRAKMDTFNDEQRLKCYCVNVTPVNYAQETRKRVDDIKKLMATQ